MKLYKKIIIIIAILLVVVGAVISAIAMKSIDWSDNGVFDLAAPNAVTYSVEEEFEDISINDISSNISFAVSDDGKCKVVCDETKNITYRVEVKDNTLFVSASETEKWYKFISFGWYDTNITVYLPEKSYGKLSATSTSGDIKVPKDLEFADVKLKSTSGDVCFLGEVKGDLTMKSTSGSVRAEKFSAKYVEAVSTSGEVTVADLKCSDLKTESISGDIEIVRVIAEKHISAECVSGDIELLGSDAETLWLKTTSGDIEGTLLSEKVFITDTLSGDVRVPATSSTTSGGKCEIKTTSGDIEISVK